jgi:hypothetical protein
VREFIKSWGDSGTVDLMAALGDLTIQTASRCLHGDDVRENLHDEVAHLYHDLDQGITPISFFLPYAPIPAHARRNGELLVDNAQQYFSCLRLRFDIVLPRGDVYNMRMCTLCVRCCCCVCAAVKVSCCSITEHVAEQHSVYTVLMLHATVHHC